MAFCTRCGQQTEADEEFCFACGGSAADAYSVGAYSGTASRVSYSPADSYATPEQPGRFPESDRGEFRLPRWAPDPAPVQQFPEPTTAGQDTRLRYTQSAAASPGSAESDDWFASRSRYPGEPTSHPMSPTGRLPEFGPGTDGQDLPGYPAAPDAYSWPGRESPPDAAPGQFTWAAPGPLLDPLSGPLSDLTPDGRPDPLSDPHSDLAPGWRPDPLSDLAPDRRPDPLKGPGDRYSYPEPDPVTGPGEPYSYPEPDAYAGLTGPRGLYTDGPSDAYAGPGEFGYSAGLSASGLSMPGGSAAPGPPGARDRSVRGDLRVDRRGQAVREPRDLPAAQPRRQGRPHSGRWITMAAATTVLIIAAAAAYVLVGHRAPAAPPARAGSPGTAVQPSGPAATSAPAATVSGLLTIAPGAATGPHEAAVVAFLNRYFHAINSHSYTAYQKLFSPSLRSGLSATTFSTGYGTTRDSAATLHSISLTTAGELEAAVTFTSHQQATASPTNSTCTAWTISLYLSKDGGRYVLQTPPAGYQPVSRSCS